MYVVHFDCCEKTKWGSSAQWKAWGTKHNGDDTSKAYETLSHICPATLRDNSEKNSLHRLNIVNLNSHERKVQVSHINGRLESLFFRTTLG